MLQTGSTIYSSCAAECIYVGNTKDSGNGVCALHTNFSYLVSNSNVESSMCNRLYKYKKNACGIYLSRSQYGLSRNLYIFFIMRTSSDMSLNYVRARGNTTISWVDAMLFVIKV